MGRSILTAAERAELIKDLGLHLPTGDMARDLTEHRRVPIRVGIVQHELRAVPDAGEGVVEVIASTDGVKRDGNRVRNDPGAWNFRDFKKNPAMTWCHDWTVPLIGVWLEEDIVPYNGSSALKLVGQFALGDEFASRIYRLYRDKIMRAWSIEWTPEEYSEMRDAQGQFTGWDFVRNTLLGCAAVPMPADPDAITLAVRSGTFTADEAASFHRMVRRDAGLVYQLSHLELPPSSADADVRQVDEPTIAPDDPQILRGVDHARFWGEVASATSALARGDVSDQMDVLCDRIEGARAMAAEPIAILRQALPVVEVGGAYGLGWRAECRRQLVRLEALFTEAQDSIVELGGMLYSLDERPPVQPEAEPAEPLSPVFAEGLEDEVATVRIGKKIATSRLEKLKECGRCLDTALGHVRSVIAEAEPGELEDTGAACAPTELGAAVGAELLDKSAPCASPPRADLSHVLATIADIRAALPRPDPVASLRQGLAALRVAQPTPGAQVREQLRKFGQRKTDFRKLARGL